MPSAIGKEVVTFWADLRAGRMPRFVRFLAVGAGGLMVDMGVFHMLVTTGGQAPLAARVVSIGVATLFTWALNRSMTFGASGRRRREEIARYALVTVGAQGFNYAVFALLVTTVLASMPKLALLAGSGMAAVFSYLGHSLFSFAPVMPGRSPRQV